MGTRVLLVRHGDGPADDRVVTHLENRGFSLDTRRPYQGDMLGVPDDDLAGTVIYGGMQNVYEIETHPSLKEEYRWIDACLGAGVPMLGLCQGAQQIAWHLGAKVGPMPGDACEFGYVEVSPTKDGRAFLPAPRYMLQAHFHEAELPTGAVHLAYSDRCENQAFRWGDKVYGLQFHPEQTRAGFARWQRPDNDLYARPGAQSKAQQDALGARHDAVQGAWFTDFLDTLFRRPE